jgi:hypothetical protein
MVFGLKRFAAKAGKAAQSFNLLADSVKIVAEKFALLRPHSPSQPPRHNLTET